MNSKNFISISELKDYINENMKLSSENIFYKYLSKIYSNLIQREENINKSKAKKFSREQKSNLFLQKDLLVNNLVPDKFNQDESNLSLNIFLDYINIQAYIGERIYKFLNKSNKSNKLSNSDFCNGLSSLYYGSIKELIYFTFCLADFNNDGKIYISDMRLILSYIPCSSEFSQKNHLKQISEIMRNFFEKKIKKENNKNEDEKELDLEIYQKFIEEYTKNSEKQTDINSEFLNEYDNNAPFFYFISIISYIFKNLPYNVKTVEYLANPKKIKLKMGLAGGGGYQSMRSQKLLSTETKKNIGIFKNISSSNNNSLFRSNATINTNRFSYNVNDKMIKEALPKIGRTNLFNIKKSSSQIFLKKENLNKAISSINLTKNKSKNKNKRTSSINKHEFIIAKKKEIPHYDMYSFNMLQDKSFESSFIQGYKKKKKLSPSNKENMSFSTTKNSSLLLSQSPNLNKIFLTPELFLNKANNNNNEMKEKFLGTRQKLPSISINQKKYSPVIGVEQYLKFNNDLRNDIEAPEEFMLCEYSENDDSNRNSLIGRDSNKSDNIFQLNEAYLFKYDENDFHQNIFNKYYALLKDKEIIFFTSEQKKEYCDLWYINKSYISTGKEFIGKNNYYTINITYENNFVKKLYFINENICQSFSLSIKSAIKDYNFNDYYETLNEVGQGHFGKVYKCKNKKSGEFYAVKIINKIKLKPTDLDLIHQEKNYLKLIKHENIISLKDFFEDKQNIYIITEFYEGGDILSYLEEKTKENEKISEKNCARIIRKIAQGIHYLNCFGIIHRDIKPENIMFAMPYNFKTLKIIDLGVCKTLSHDEKANEPIGTNGYISPEIYLHNPYSFKVDIWSLGVILYLLITGGILPFDDVNMDCKIVAQKVIYLQQEYPEEYFGDKSKKLVNLLDKMLEKNDSKRININNLLKDSWFDMIRKEKI